jgi:protein-tyrosine-phosphatase
VVFVCEHGTVKSLMAREWFNRLARERGLTYHAESRGVAPDPSVPPAVAAALRRDGFDLAGFSPRPLAATDLGAVRIVTIGVDPASIRLPAGTSIEAWDDIPPATERYEASRDALRARIERLLMLLPTRR